MSGSERTAFLTVDRVSKTFPSRRGSAAVTALQDVSLSVQQGEMIALLGASGSGKTTLLRCIAGLEKPDGGEIDIGGQQVFSAEGRVDVSPDRRALGMIFQSYALWPHMTVFQNVVYPLRRRKFDKSDREDRVMEYLELVECRELSARYPHELSGGQQQRISLARSLVYEPRLVLFDEPLSNLDAGLREQLRYYIRRVKEAVGFTGVYVTHDQAEAFYVGDVVAVMAGGEVLQCDKPAAVYSQPRTRHVAAFLGASNALAGVIAARDGGLVFVADGNGEIGMAASAAGHGVGPGDRAMLLCRPEDVSLSREPTGLDGKVVDRVTLGRVDECVLELSGQVQWRCREQPGIGPSRGESVHLALAAGRAYVYPMEAEAT